MQVFLLIVALISTFFTLPNGVVSRPYPAVRYQSCSYYSDPHLSPFSQPYHVYWCQKPGWELVLSNNYVTLYALIGQNPYYIIDYILVFPGQTSCTIYGTTGLSLCAPGSSVTSVAWGSAVFHFHQSQHLFIRIVKHGGRFDFYIRQSTTLVENSCGICVKWDCPFEKRLEYYHAAAYQICENFIAAARSRVIGEIDPAIVDNVNTSCLNDIQTSFNTETAKASANIIIQDSVNNLLSEQDPETVFKNAERAIQEAIAEATQKTNEYLKGIEPVCNDAGQCLLPLTLEK